MSDNRFVKTYSQGVVDVVEIWVDKETGVNYVFRSGGYAGGMTPLLDSAGIHTESRQHFFTDGNLDFAWHAYFNLQ